jgi:hypothetical protein
MVALVTMMFMMIHWCWSFYEPVWCQTWLVPRRETMFSNELRGINWRGHIYSECGRMVRCELYHIQPREGVLCDMPMRSWGILE